MSPDRALEINGRLVLAYLHQQGISETLPDLDDVTPAEALEAAHLAAGIPGRKNPDGSTSQHLILDQPETVLLSFAYAVLNTPRPAAEAEPSGGPHAIRP